MGTDWRVIVEEQVEENVTKEWTQFENQITNNWTNLKDETKTNWKKIQESRAAMDKTSWKFVKEQDLDRDYILFSLLTGVRGPYKPLFPQRKIENCSWESVELLSKYSAKNGYHHHTWFFTKELISKLDELGPLRACYERCKTDYPKNWSVIEQEFDRIDEQREYSVDVSELMDKSFNPEKEKVTYYDIHLLGEFTPKNQFASFYSFLNQQQESNDTSRIIVCFS